jgi:hypothetical protein
MAVRFPNFPEVLAAKLDADRNGRARYRTARQKNQVISREMMRAV